MAHAQKRIRVINKELVMAIEPTEMEMFAESTSEGDAPELSEPEPEKKVIPKARPKKKALTMSVAMSLPDMIASLQRGEEIEGRSGARLTSITGAFVTVITGQTSKSMHVYGAYKTYVKT